MATIIDKLTVLLNLDNTSFKKGIKESEREKDTFEGKNKKFDKQRAEAEKKSELRKETFQKKDMARNRQTLDGFTKLRNEAIAFLTIFTAGKGILSFVSDTITTTAAMGRLSDNIGTSVKDLAGLKFAMQEVGGSANDAAGTIQKAADAVGSMKSGMANSTVNGMMALSSGTGVNIAEALKHGAKSFLMAEADVLQILSKKVGPNQALTMYKHLAGGDDNSFNMLKQGSMGLSQQMMKGAALSGDNGARAKASERMQRQWVEISTRMENVGKNIMFRISPTVFKLLDRLAAWAGNKENLKAMTGYMDDFAKTLKGIDFTKFGEGATSGLRGILGVLKELLDVMNGLHDLGVLGAVAGTAITTGDNNPMGVKRNTATNQEVGHAALMAMTKFFLGNNAAAAQNNVSVDLKVTAPQGTKVEAQHKSPTGSVHIVRQADAGM